MYDVFRMVRNIEAHNVPIISAGNSTLRNSQAPEPPDLSTSERVDIFKYIYLILKESSLLYNGGLVYVS